MIRYTLAQYLRRYRIYRFNYNNADLHYLNKDGDFEYKGLEYYKFNSRRFAIQTFKKYLPDQELIDRTVYPIKIIK